MHLSSWKAHPCQRAVETPSSCLACEHEAPEFGQLIDQPTMMPNVWVKTCRVSIPFALVFFH